jgi:hypothetical protein
LGHEFGTKSAEGNVASGRSSAVIAATVGRSFFHGTSMIIRATPATRSRFTSVVNALGDPNSANRPNKTSHTGMVAVRLNSIDIVVTVFLCDLRTTAPPRRRRAPIIVSSGCAVASGGDLGVLG